MPFQRGHCGTVGDSGGAQLGPGDRQQEDDHEMNMR
jgi:hypothetical protein